MKKTITFIYALIMLVTASTVFAQTKVDNPSTKSRRVYCVSMFNPNFQDEFGTGYGITVFNTGDPSNSMQLLYRYTDGFSIYAGAAANDTYYAYFYQYGSRGPEPVGIRSVNLRTGEEKTIVNWIGKNHGDWPKFQDMTYDYKTNTMYAIAFQAGESYLVTVDLTNGDLKKVVSFERTVGTIAADSEGKLYVIDTNGDLCSLNKENGTMTKIMSTQYPPSINQSMEFDHTDGALYWATGETGVDESYLIKFDLTKKAYENLGILGGVGTQVVGMYIPFLRTGFDVPAAATEINVIPGETGAEKATINWKNPTQTYGEESLLEITSLTISRDDEVIKTYDKVEDLVLGKAMSFEDNTVKSGMHVYSICATNSAGAGEEGKIDRFVGFDKPAIVKDLTIQTNAPCKSATLIWKAPTEGQYGGYFENSDLSYTIVRFPDETEIATNIKELTFTDETSQRLTGFTYQVYANNKMGASKAAVSKKVVIGNALTTPYTFDFIDDGAFNNNWMVYDNSGDRNTWQILSPMGKMYFNDKQLLPAAEYLMDDMAEHCDEWLITPPITLNDREKKVLTFGVRNRGLDFLRVTMGNNNTFESQVVELKRMEISSKLPESDEEAVPFDIVSIDLGEIAGTFCFGFHLQTPNNGSSVIFQLSDVYVGAPNAITNEMISDVNLFNIDNTLNITGEFTNAQVYNPSGVCMGQADANQSQINTSNWPSGVYYVKVMNGNSAKVHKIVIR